MGDTIFGNKSTALLFRLPREALRGVRLLVRPETVLRWHRDLIARRMRGSPGPNGVDPAPQRTSTTWATFLRCQAHAIIAADFFETTTLNGTRLCVLAVIEHTTRRVRILGATAHPSAAWMAQAARNLVMDLGEARCRVTYLIRDRDARYPTGFDVILAGAAITVVLSSVRMPRMNSIMERWIQSCRRELLDRTLIWNQAQLLHALPEYEWHHNRHRPHRGIANAPRCIHYPNRSPIQRRSRVCASADTIDSAASSTNTSMPPDQRG
jgi:putative transposase